MISTRTIESTVGQTIHTEVKDESTATELDLLAKKIFAATMAYVVIFIIATVLLIAL